ncbi:hypothetical protein L7F22_062655 [Adiantum nelumboides]|nr:hypothetical protein [Adiantum nelumboides]
MRKGVIAYPPPAAPSPSSAPLDGADTKKERVSSPPQLLHASPHVALLLTSRKMRLSYQPALSFKAALFASTGLFRPPTLSQIYSGSPSPEETLCPPPHPHQVADLSSLSANALLPTISDETLRCQIAQSDTKPTHIPGILLNPFSACNSPAAHLQGESTGASSATSSVTSFHTISMASQQHEVVIALGSNMGNRVSSFEKALSMMRRAGIDVISHSSLYESAPAYVTDQPKFLNSAVRASTRLDPSSLLGILKGIERTLGRTTNGIRYGPRPIDLDILFYGDMTFSDENLTLPHPLIWERPFVLAPLMDLYNTKLSHVWTKRFEKAKCSWQLLGGDNQLGQDGLKRVVPIAGKLWHWSDRTYVMGIVNVTPDSFSDGGKYFSVKDAVSQAEALVHAGADIIDLGAQSTRPFATKLTSEEELTRLIPVLDAIKKLPHMESVWLSVDTFYSKVAREAVKHGVHMVNDVSGGSLDPDMYQTVAELGVPYVVMHMRGDPKTMLHEKNIQYKNVSADVSLELCESLRKAESLGIPAWRLVVDPGLGFSKTSEQSVHLLGDLSAFRLGLGSWSLTATKLPMLIGPSRKQFLGKICNREKAEDRDTATIGAAVAAIAQGVDIVRLHNVKASIDAIRVADAIFKTKDLTKYLKQEGAYL